MRRERAAEASTRVLKNLARVRTRAGIPSDLCLVLAASAAVMALATPPASGSTDIVAGGPAVAAQARGTTALQLPGEWPPVATFSILGYDPDTGMVGGAVQSRVFSVGNGVLWGEANVGMVATQAIVDVSYGPQALELLRRGLTPGDVVRTVWDTDPDPRPDRWTKQGRQFSVMNAAGEVATYTGPEASDWAGHKIGAYCSAQGNILAGEAVVNDMVAAFEATGGHLSMRLLAALEAGQAAGGDRRGMQSAAILIVQEDGGVWLNNDVVLRLQVDDNPEPIAELRRLIERAHDRFGWERQ